MSTSPAVNSLRLAFLSAVLVGILAINTGYAVIYALVAGAVVGLIWHKLEALEK